MKVGKVAAFALGGGIIVLQVAAHQGYIKINWDKVQKKAEKISDKVEEKITGEGPKMLDKVINCDKTVKFQHFSVQSKLNIIFLSFSTSIKKIL